MKYIAALILAMVLGFPALAHVSPNAHVHPHAGPALEAATCPANKAMGTLGRQLAEGQISHVVITGESLAAFADAIQTLTGAAKPPQVEGLVIAPDPREVAQPAVNVAMFDKDMCALGVTKWPSSAAKKALNMTFGQEMQD